MREDQRELARLLSQLEGRLADLYSTCSVYYPGDFDLWRSLALDEAEHARKADILMEAAEQGQLRFAETGLRLYRLRATLEHISEIKTAVIASTIDGVNALKLAMSLEESLEEKALFQQYEGGDEVIQKVLAQLELETIRHGVVLRQAHDRRTNDILRLTSS